MKSIEEFINLVDEISHQITEMENVERQMNLKLDKIEIKYNEMKNI